jgi:hypothetical protein
VVTFALEHGRPAFAEADGLDRGEDAAVAPHTGGGSGARFSCDAIADGGSSCGGEIVTDVEGAGAVGAEGLGCVGRGVLMAAGAFEVGDLGHESRVHGGYRVL